jgi:excinuclease UvrABC helicase subunit UvrB
MNEQDKTYRNLVKLLKLFQNRPNHLAKYLIDNVAFSDLFLKMVLESGKLNEETNTTTPSFKDIQEMKDFYNLFEESSNKKSSPKKILEDMKEKLDECLRLEKYEDAIRIRDYITKLTTKIGTKDT